MNAKQHVTSYYTLAVSKSDAKISGFHKKLNQLSYLRLAAFLAAILCVYVFGSIQLLYGIGSGMLFLVAFFYLIKKHIRLQATLKYNLNFRKVLQNELNNLSSGDNLYPDGSKYANPAHPYTDDLDIFGKASVFQAINRCTTQTGNKILATWLQNLQDKTLIRERQEALTELKNHIEKTYWFRAHLLPHQQNELNDLSEAIKHPFKKLLAFTDSNILRVYTAIAPWLTFALLLLVVFTSLSWKLFIPLLFLHYLINSRYSKNIHMLHELTGRSSQKIQVYARLLQWMETTAWTSVYLQRLIAACRSKTNSKPAFEQTSHLATLISQLDYRFNIIVSIVLNLGFLWDIRCAYKIRRWHEHSSETVANSLETIGEFEALISLSTLSFNHPDWVFPEIRKGFAFDAAGMGHPLIPEEKRVSNDFHFAPEKTVDVITGSNMAGKSTFLRTIGVNMVLAFAGAPVCCKRLALSPMKLVSYMRIKDSLNESTSTFKAEIDRLKIILEQSAREENSFALIDEMLRGTNSRDKYLGTKAFIERLIRENAATILATHDLQVAELAQQYPQRVRNYHFDIQTNGQEMFFDYKVKTGECKTFNASILLKQIGLEIDDNEVHTV